MRREKETEHEVWLGNGSQTSVARRLNTRWKTLATMNVERRLRILLVHVVVMTRALGVLFDAFVCMVWGGQGEGDSAPNVSRLYNRPTTRLLFWVSRGVPVAHLGMTLCPSRSHSVQRIGFQRLSGIPYSNGSCRRGLREAWKHTVMEDAWPKAERSEGVRPEEILIHQPRPASEGALQEHIAWLAKISRTQTSRLSKQQMESLAWWGILWFTEQLRSSLQCSLRTASSQSGMTIACQAGAFPCLQGPLKP
eukprot:3743582-Amphidinium_carterae.1